MDTIFIVNMKEHQRPKKTCKTKKKMYKLKRENETQNKVAICTKQNVNIPKVIWITPILTKLKKENLMLNVMAKKWDH
jgi:hypothetical protein